MCFGLVRAVLPLETARYVTVAIISPDEREQGHPGFAADDPAFIGRHQSVGSVESSEIHFHLVGGAPETDEPQRGQK